MSESAFQSREIILFPLVSIAVFMIFLSFGTSHLSLTILLVVLLLSLNFRENQTAKRRKRLEEHMVLARKKSDTEWMISALEFFRQEIPETLRVSYTTLDDSRTKQLKPIRQRILSVAKGIVATFPRAEVGDVCASTYDDDLSSWDRPESAYLMCALQNIWAPNQPEWVYKSLMQQYGTAPLMLCWLAVRAYFSTVGDFLNPQETIPAPEDLLTVNEQNEIRMVMDYDRFLFGATREFLTLYSDGASVEKIDDLIERLRTKKAISVQELRWILTAEYAARFKGTSTSKWEIAKQSS